MAVVIFAWTSIGQTQGFSVLLIPLTEQLEISSRDVALIFLVGAFGGAFFMPFVGRLLDERGARRILIASTVLYAVAFCVLALVPIKSVAIVALLVVRLIGSIVLWLGASVLVSWWFTHKRGLALGVLVGAGSALLSIMAYALSIAIDQAGFETSFLVLAALACVVLLPILIWGVVDHPGQIGQYPDGQVPAGEQEPRGPVHEKLAGVTAGEAYRTGFAWVITLGAGLIAMATTGYLFYEAVIFIEQGATAADAARNLLPQMIGNGVFILIVSALVDRYRMRWIVPVAMVQLAFTIWWGFNLDVIDSLVLFGISFGMATGVFFGYALAALPKYFGTKHVGEIRGTFGAITMATAAFGPIVFEIFQENSATALIVITAVAAVAISIASLVIRWPKEMNSLETSPVMELPTVGRG
jgi:MFS family permease